MCGGENEVKIVLILVGKYCRVIIGTNNSVERYCTQVLLRYGIYQVTGSEINPCS
jgi:hypothetical protein